MLFNIVCFQYKKKKKTVSIFCNSGQNGQSDALKEAFYNLLAFTYLTHGTMHTQVIEILLNFEALYFREVCV